MSKKIIIAPLGEAKLPLAHDPKRHVDRPMEVVSTVYYRRAIRRGDIKQLTSMPSKTKKTPKPKTAEAKETK